MGPHFTKLAPKNYDFLHRFIDATKANLFFARGIIFVEGDAENLLLPTIAKIINRPLHRYGVSIVNVGSTAFLHYAKIFYRKDNQKIDVKVAVITDLDVRPIEYYEELKEKKSFEEISKEKKDKYFNLTTNFNKGNVKVFISPNWTLEYEIALTNLRKCFFCSILWSEKKENAKTGIPQESKKEEVKKKVYNTFKKWEKDWNDNKRKNENIAYQIYKKVLVDKDISKAITAQVFTKSLNKLYIANNIKAYEAINKANALMNIVSGKEEGTLVE